MLMPAIVLGGKGCACWVVEDVEGFVVRGSGGVEVVVLERRVWGADAMSPPARLVICGLGNSVVAYSVVFPESGPAVAKLDEAAAVAVAETYAGDVGVDTDGDEDEDKESESATEELEVASELAVVVAVVVEPTVLCVPTAVAASPARAGKIDKSLSAHAT
jgi:hypothetical protein